jgi:cytoskeleton protein RodZ
MQRGTTISVGPALRRVRTKRGLTLDEAARDTRIRREFLDAIEQEDFDRLLGDVHVRGCLRTYASYLRLSPDKVVAAYSSTRQDDPPTPIATTEPLEPALGRPRRRDNHRLIGMIAATLLVLAVAFGVLSARNSAPAPADLSTQAPSGAALPATSRDISVGVVATQPVDVTVVIDTMAQQTYHLERGEARGFTAHESLTVHVSDGGAVDVTVAGHDLGAPAAAGQPWEATYSYDTSSP